MNGLVGSCRCYMLLDCIMAYGLRHPWYSDRATHGPHDHVNRIVRMMCRLRNHNLIIHGWCNCRAPISCCHTGSITCNAWIMSSVISGLHPLSIHKNKSLWHMDRLRSPRVGEQWVIHHCTLITTHLYQDVHRIMMYRSHHPWCMRIILCEEDTHRLLHHDFMWDTWCIISDTIHCLIMLARSHPSWIVSLFITMQIMQSMMDLCGIHMVHGLSNPTRLIMWSAIGNIISTIMMHINDTKDTVIRSWYIVWQWSANGTIPDHVDQWYVDWRDHHPTTMGM